MLVLKGVTSSMGPPAYRLPPPVVCAYNNILAMAAALQRLHTNGKLAAYLFTTLAADIMRVWQNPTN
jgi:hypothetical protein